MTARPPGQSQQAESPEVASRPGGGTNATAAAAARYDAFDALGPVDGRQGGLPLERVCSELQRGWGASRGLGAGAFAAAVPQGAQQQSKTA